MKLSQSLSRSSRFAAGRIFSLLPTCLVAAAAILATPVLAQTSISMDKEQRPGGEAVTGPGTPQVHEGMVPVLIEMSGAPAGVTYAQELKVAQSEAAALKTGPAGIPLSATSDDKVPRVQISATATSRVQSRLLAIEATQQALLPSLSNLDARVIYRTQRAYNGIAVFVDPDKISALAELPGVKAVHSVSLQYPTAFSSVDFLGTRTFWNKAYAQGVGIHGENIKVAVIDTGLDYLHTNFGGPGTDAAYASIKDKTPVPNPYFPTAKVPGGFDFAGDAYTGNNLPNPDPNPLDTNSHGTKCASVVGGLGVNFGGTTYVGNYDSSTPISSLKIGPGIAPQAKLYPLRVFGTNGGTLLLPQAVDWAMDPNGDGDFSDRMDVLSISLGSDGGNTDNSSSIAVANASAAGIVVCCSAGNAGDNYYITGSSANANGVLSVAASYNDQTGFIANASVTGQNAQGQNVGSIAGQKGFAIYSNSSPHTKVSGNIVYAVPADSGGTAPNGTTPLTNAAQVSGNIVLIDRGTSTFSEKAQRAMAAGAIGIIIANNQRTDVPNNDPIIQDTSTSVPALTIPDVMISKEDGDYIKSQALFNPATGVPTNPTVATIQEDNTPVSRPNAPADTLPSYSSRGPRSNDSYLKPDITGPAEVVGVAEIGTNKPSGSIRNQVSLHNGTSSSTPHVAGGMALMKQLHPTWSVEELMALAMNTSFHNLETNTARTTAFGDGRVGAGRVDLNLASQANVVAFNGTDRGLVSISFGSVEVPIDSAVHLVKNLIVRNKGTVAVTYNISYAENGPAVGDAYYGTTSPLTVSVPASGDIVIPIQFNATGNTLRHTRDASTGNAQATDFGTFGRVWLTEKEGYVVLTPQNSSTEPTLRIPVYTAPKPAAAMHATINRFVPTADSGQFTIPLSGSGIATGGTVASGGITSLVKAFELSYASPLAGSANAPEGDRFRIKYVGVTSDYSSYGADHTPTTLSFAIDTFGDSTVPDYYFGDERYIYLDTDKNGTDDYRIEISTLFANLPPPSQTGNNVYFSYAFNLYNNSGFAEYPVNGLASNQLEANVFNNSLRVISFDARDVGYTNGASSFNYHVVTYNDRGQQVDDTGTLTYDLARAGIDTHAAGVFEPSGNYFQDAAGNSINVKYNGANFQANKSKGVLLAHLHNGKGNRADVVILAKPTITAFTPTHGKVGTTVSITGTNFGPGTKVFFNGTPATDVRVLSETTVEAAVPAGATSGPITVSNAGGSSASTGTFTVD
jgi:subtilisin family serine protease